jgi:DNA-binding transcriptional MerR regulator
MDTHLTIQQTASRTGFSEHTLRYYEKIGLIPPVERASNGHRRYTDVDLGRLDFLKCLRSTGMPVAQMIEFTHLTQAGDHTIQARVALLQEHRACVLQEIQALQEDLEVIHNKIHWYNNLIEEES